jgi:hypothetical protein
MNRAQSGFARALLALACLVPFGSAMADNDRGGGNSSSRAVGALTLPVAGTIAGGGVFNGTVTVNRFARQNGRVVAIGFVSGTATSASGVVLGTALKNVALPVSLGNTPLASTSELLVPGMMPAAWTGGSDARWVPTQLSCGILHLELGPLDLNLLGITVNLNRVILDIGGEAPGLLGVLVCQLLGGGLDVLNLLNAILALLSGLLGGLSV